MENLDAVETHVCRKIDAVFDASERFVLKLPERVRRDGNSVSIPGARLAGGLLRRITTRFVRIGSGYTCETDHCRSRP